MSKDENDKKVLEFDDVKAAAIKEYEGAVMKALHGESRLKGTQETGEGLNTVQFKSYIMANTDIAYDPLLLDMALENLKAGHSIHQQGGNYILGQG